MKALDFRLTFSTEWGIGTGGGRHGEVDRTIRRDAAGLPFVPGKSLLAALRDAAERLAWGLDGGRRGPWHGWLDLIFGTQPGRTDAGAPVVYGAPVPARLIVGDARIEGARELDGGAPPGGERPGWTTLKPGVALDPKTGTARDRTLRVEEVARRGVTLTASGAWLDGLDGESLLVATAFLAAACGLVERIGGRRRRGHGRCKVTLEGVAPDQIRDVLSAKSAPAVPPPPTPDLSRPVLGPIESAPLPDRHGGREKTDQPVVAWSRQQFTLRALTPLIIPRAVLGNVVTSEDRIPGTYLLGWLGRALSAAGWSERLAEEIAAERIVVTHATPEVAGTRGLSAPMAWFKPKEGTGLPVEGQIWVGCDVVNRLVADAPGNQLKGYRRGWVSDAAPGQWPWYRDLADELIQTTHNTIDDRVQRPTQDVGGVYSYGAIPAGTVFRFEVRWAGDLPGAWWAQCPGSIRLGRAKRGEYGQASVGVLPTGGTEPPHVPVVGPKDSVLTVWLLSEVLLRGPGLRPVSAAETLRSEIEQSLKKISETIRLEPDEREGQLHSLLRPARVDSWSARWQLPRPSLVGLAAGGVVRYRVVGVPEGNQEAFNDCLAGIEAAGVGERRAEGYGQVRFNDIRLDARELEAPASSRNPADPGAPTGSDSPDSERRTHALEPPPVAMLEARIAAAVARGMRDEAWPMLGGGDRSTWPSASQLGGLRSAITRLERVGTYEGNPLTAWLDALEKTHRWRDLWPETVLERLRSLARVPAEVENLLASPELTEETAAMTLRAFIGGLLRHIRRESEKAPQRASGETLLKEG
ncbi:MAG: hypothetical protein AMXMBFR64_38840 [Myxococcales bacterium]